MKVVKVLYQKVFPLAQYVNEKIGIEIELDTSKGDDPDHAFDNAKSFVEKWHKLGNPSLHFSVAAPASIELPIIQNDTEERKLGISIEDIRSCNSLVVLDAYKGIIRDNDVLMKHYNTRREQLVNESK